MNPWVMSSSVVATDSLTHGSMMTQNQTVDGRRHGSSIQPMTRVEFGGGAPYDGIEVSWCDGQ